MSLGRTAMSLCLVATAALLPASASAQTASPLSLDPNGPGEGTTLLVGLYGSALSPDGQTPTSMTFALPRGMRIDTRARARLCTREQARRAHCPKDSAIGFGSAAVTVKGFLSPGGETEVAWSTDAYLGVPVRAGDAASIVLRTELLGADRVDQLLAPLLGAKVTRVSVITGRVARSGSRLEVRFDGFPGLLAVSAPLTAAPARFELAIGAVRRVRKDFVRRIRVRTLTGYEIQRVPDHRLVGYDLLRTPEGCSGSWAYELRLGFPSGVERTAGRAACTRESH